MNINGEEVGPPEGAPLDCVLASRGYKGFYRSVKLGRLRGVCDDSVTLGNSRRVVVEGAGLVNPLDYYPVGEEAVRLRLSPTLGSRLASAIHPVAKAGFQDSPLFRAGWRRLWGVVTSSANIPSLSDFGEPRHLEAGVVESEVVVVGAGLAGLGAAEALSERGVDFVLVDPWPEKGGRTRFLDRRVAGGEETYSQMCSEVWAKASKGGRFLRGVFTGVYEEGSGFVYASNQVWRVKFHKVVYATGSRSPPPLVHGNDLPGVVSAQYALRLARYGALMGAITVYSEDEYGAMVYNQFKELGLDVALVSDAPADGKVGGKLLRVRGRREVEEVVFMDSDGRTVSRKCKWLVYSTRRQPACELPVQGGVAYVYRVGEGFRVAPPRKVDEAEERRVWVAGSVTGVYQLEASYHHGKAVGYAAAGYPQGFFEESSKLAARTGAAGATADRGDAAHVATGNPGDADAMLCFCEDVAVSDVADAVRRGITDPQKVKRLTGWLTGQCQGKLCLANGLRVISSTIRGEGGELQLPTQRLPALATPLGALASASGSGEGD